jgi:hypothetical protein
VNWRERKAEGGQKWWPHEEGETRKLEEQKGEWQATKRTKLAKEEKSRKRGLTGGGRERMVSAGVSVEGLFADCLLVLGIGGATSSMSESTTVERAGARVERFSESALRAALGMTREHPCLDRAQRLHREWGEAPI